MEILNEIDWGKTFGLIGTFLTIVLGYFAQRQKDRAKKAEHENRILKETVYKSKKKTVKEIFDIQRFGNLEFELKEIFKGTKIDRLLIIFMMNGKVYYDYITILFDQGNENMQMDDFDINSRYRIGEEYHMMIRDMEVLGHTWRFGPNFKLGNIGLLIEYSGIRHILYGLINRIHIDEDNDIILFTALTSSYEGELTKNERIEIESKFYLKIKPILTQLVSLPDGD